MAKHSKQSNRPSLQELLERVIELRQQEDLSGPRRRLASSGRPSGSTGLRLSDDERERAARALRIYEGRESPDGSANTPTS